MPAAVPSGGEAFASSFVPDERAVEGRLHEVSAMRDELKAAIEDLRQVIR